MGIPEVFGPTLQWAFPTHQVSSPCCPLDGTPSTGHSFHRLTLEDPEWRLFHFQINWTVQTVTPCSDWVKLVPPCCMLLLLTSTLQILKTQRSLHVCDCVMQFCGLCMYTVCMCMCVCIINEHTLHVIMCLVFKFVVVKLCVCIVCLCACVCIHCQHIYMWCVPCFHIDVWVCCLCIVYCVLVSASVHMRMWTHLYVIVYV